MRLHYGHRDGTGRLTELLDEVDLVVKIIDLGMAMSMQQKTSHASNIHRSWHISVGKHPVTLEISQTCLPPID
jgi:hypothetical protein